MALNSTIFNIFRVSFYECAKFRASRAFVPYVPYVPTYFTCFTCSRAFVPLSLRALRAFIFLPALRAFTFLSVSNF